MAKTRTDAWNAAAAAGFVAGGLWSTYCVHASMTSLQAMSAKRYGRRAVSDNAETHGVIVVVPMIHEADRASQFVAHWCGLLEKHSRLRLCVVTTERERIEAPAGPYTWDVLRSDPRMESFMHSGRAEIAHFPGVNRTYGEQLGWALDRLASATERPAEYFYIANADSRLSDKACAEIIDLADAGINCAQQSSLFFGNVREVTWPAVGEALYQSRWTLETEVFRYLVGAGQIAWIPTWLQRMWYQHAVGHGLLLSRRYYKELGGLPRAKYGLEDAALGFTIRAAGGHVHPFATLECGDAPASVRELQRQRSTWVRGPLCAGEYLSGWQDIPLAAQGLYDGLKWSLGLPAKWLLILLMAPRSRLVAVTGMLLGLYGPILRLLVGLNRLEVNTCCRPQRRDIARGLLSYSIAPLSYWSGGFRGLCRLIHEVFTDSPSMQQRTRETA